MCIKRVCNNLDEKHDCVKLIAFNILYVTVVLLILLRPIMIPDSTLCSRLKGLYNIGLYYSTVL